MGIIATFRRYGSAVLRTADRRYYLGPVEYDNRLVFSAVTPDGIYALHFLTVDAAVAHLKTYGIPTNRGWVNVERDRSK